MNLIDNTASPALPCWASCQHKIKHTNIPNGTTFRGRCIDTKLKRWLMVDACLVDLDGYTTKVKYDDYVVYNYAPISGPEDAVISPAPKDLDGSVAYDAIKAIDMLGSQPFFKACVDGMMAVWRRTAGRITLVERLDNWGTATVGVCFTFRHTDRGCAGGDQRLSVVSITNYQKIDATLTISNSGSENLVNF